MRRIVLHIMSLIAELAHLNPVKLVAVATSAGLWVNM